jgi:hypothetical protein
MTSALEAHIAVVEREAQLPPGATIEDRASALEDLITIHRSVFEIMDRRIGPDGLSEVHRPFIPLFQRWIDAARQIVVRARELRAQDRVVAGIDDLVCEINAAKLVAEHFDSTVASNERVRRGEPPGPSRLLSEVLDELRAADRSNG